MIKQTAEHQRRFAGVARLYGDAAAFAFAESHIAVVGVGGVGSWAVEALARSGVGRLTLIDFDHVAASNVNRQLPALTSQFGKAKTQVLQERIAEINPDCQVQIIDTFIEVETIYLLNGFDYVIDAIDQVRVKAAMIAYCKQQKIPIIMVGAAGGKVDVTKIRIDDLSLTIQDPIASKVRALLRKNYAFPRHAAKFKVECVYSSEPLRYPQASCQTEQTTAPQGLNCAGFGSAVSVTASFGFFAAGRVLQNIAKLHTKNKELL